MSGEAVRKLYITLRRSFAGTRETQRKTLQSLGLRYREQTVVQNNDGSTRGAIDKVACCTTCAMQALKLLKCTEASSQATT